MLTTDDKSPEAGKENQSKMDVLDKSLDALLKIQVLLDFSGFSMSSIHLNDAIETLRSDKVRLQKNFKV